METPKEKASELIKKFRPLSKEGARSGNFWSAKQCAIIAVDEILSFLTPFDPSRDYWQQVKAELTNPTN